MGVCIHEGARVLGADTATFRVFSWRNEAAATVTLEASVRVGTLAKLKQAAKIALFEQWPDFSFRGHSPEELNRPLHELGYVNGKAYRLVAVKRNTPTPKEVAQPEADMGETPDAIELFCKFNSDGREEVVKISSDKAGSVYNFLMEELEEYLVHDKEYYAVLLDGDRMDRNKDWRELGFEVGRRYYIDFMTRQTGG